MGLYRYARSTASVQRPAVVGFPAMLLLGALGGLFSGAIAQTATTPNQGRSLYYQICAPCHGQDAKGGGPVPDLKAFSGTDEKFVQVSLNGRPDRGMPAWKGKLSEEELQAILAFIHTLSQ